MRLARRSPFVERNLEEATSCHSLIVRSWPVTCEDFSAEPDFLFSAHVHASPHICFVIDGALIEGNRGRSRWLTPGMGRLSPGGDAHRLAVGGETSLRCLILEMEPGFLENSGIPLLDSRQYVTGRGVVDLSRRLVAELVSGDDASPISLEMLAIEAVALGRTAGGGKVDPAPGWVDRVLQRLLDDLRAVPTLAELSVIAGVSRAHLARGFRAHFGCTVGQYVRGRRLDAARRLILRSDLPLALVAWEAGFSDQSHMTRLVSARFGHPPARMRALCPPA